MQKLPKNYSKRGAFLVCPHCNHETHVGHFAWVALVCLNCRAEVNKEDWYLSDWQNAQQNAHQTGFPPNHRDEPFCECDVCMGFVSRANRPQVA